MGKYIMALLLLANITTAVVSGETIAADIISVDRLREIQIAENKDYILVDVSSLMAYNIEHIAGAINIPQDEIKARSSELPLDKLVVTYCHCGGASVAAKAAAEDLKNIGFKKVAYLGSPEEAFKKYKDSGYPVVVDTMSYTVNSASTSTDITSDGIFPFVSAEILYSRIKNHPEELGNNFVVIDIRGKSEYAKSHINGALNIPLKSLLKKGYKGLPKDKEIFVYADDDAASKIAVKELKKHKFEMIYYISGGFNNWNKNKFND